MDLHYKSYFLPTSQSRRRSYGRVTVELCRPCTKTYAFFSITGSTRSQKESTLLYTGTTGICALFSTDNSSFSVSCRCHTRSSRTVIKFQRARCHTCQTSRLVWPFLSWYLHPVGLVVLHFFKRVLKTKKKIKHAATVTKNNNMLNEWSRWYKGK